MYSGQYSNTPTVESAESLRSLWNRVHQDISRYIPATRISLFANMGLISLNHKVFGHLIGLKVEKTSIEIYHVPKMTDTLSSFIKITLLVLSVVESAVRSVSDTIFVIGWIQRKIFFFCEIFTIGINNRVISTKIAPKIDQNCDCDLAKNHSLKPNSSLAINLVVTSRQNFLRI